MSAAHYDGREENASKSFVQLMNTTHWETVVVPRLSSIVDYTLDTLVELLHANRADSCLVGAEHFTALSMSCESLAATGTGNEFLTGTLPVVIQYAAKMPQLVPELKILKTNCIGTLDLTREQVFAVLSAAFLGLIPPQDGQLDSRQKFDFKHILQEDIEKCKCILLYFIQAAPVAGTTFKTEKVSFQRRVLLPDAPQHQEDFWQQSTLVLCGVDLQVEGGIDDIPRTLHADFAYELIGGGVLCGGNLQEEIRFTVCPELIVSMLFCEVMSPAEAIIVVGADFFSRHCGYGSQFTCVGPALAARMSALDPHGRRDVHLCAFDALMSPGNFQYTQEGMLRELVKAVIAFEGDEYEGDRRRAVSTGNWGCGVCGGDPDLKFLLQWMACTVAGRCMNYYPRENLANVQACIAKWEGQTVSAVWRELNKKQ